MTGDETNKHNPNVHEGWGSCTACSSDPVASNTGKESGGLKPCPFCGCTEELVGECAKCDSYPTRLEKWNNAWAHKRIAELEERLMNGDEYCLALDQKLKTAGDALLAALAVATKELLAERDGDPRIG